MPRLIPHRRNFDSYFELVKRFPLCPIRDDVQLDRAIETIDALLDRFKKLDPSERDYLDVLGDLVRKRESEHDPLESSIPDNEMLRYLIEERAVTQVEVARETGIAESTISCVLSGERKLTRSQIGSLAKFFGVEVGVFSFA